MEQGWTRVAAAGDSPGWAGALSGAYPIADCVPDRSQGSLPTESSLQGDTGVVRAAFTEGLSDEVRGYAG